MQNTWIELDLERLVANIAVVRQGVGPDAEIMFVVKSEAYGHGMLKVATAATAAGVNWFVVAHIDEALALRAALPDVLILVVGVMGAEHVGTAQAHGIIPVLAGPEHARSLAAAASGPLVCHAKIDTGMGRIGFVWDEAAKQLAAVHAGSDLDIQGICTHFASADGNDRSFADEQFSRFEMVLDACAEQGLTNLFRHAANSGGVLQDTAWGFDGVRPGILLYGYGPALSTDRSLVMTTRPFLQWKTRVVHVKRVTAGFRVGYDSTYVTQRETCIATLDAGYADGYPRLLSNIGCVLVGGRRVPIAGRVTMNLTVVDLGPDAEVAPGDEAVLLGEQGGDGIWADELAVLAQTIPYEILTNIRASADVVHG